MEGYLKKEDRKKILLICDDITMHSGISTMAREIVLGTAHKYNWVNIGGAINHPQKGNRIDLSQDSNKITGLEDTSIIMYPMDGYGNQFVLRQIMEIEKPDALMLFTDPRYFIWVFQMENEIRKNIPIIYLNIWDDLPAPLYNKPFYESCDTLLAISKQTENINKVVLGDKAKDKIIKYVPHGINEKEFFPITPEYSEYKEFLSFKKDLLKDDYEFVVFFNARNIRRKNPGDVILSYVEFIKKLPKDKAKKCALLMHTDPIDDNGTDLLAVKELLETEETNVIFTNKKYEPKYINWLYNCADVTMLISSNEGWGLSLTESMMAGRVILGNVTGGMQDQMRFEDENGEWIKFTDVFLSNHFGTYKKHGKWAFPVFPTNMSLVGSVPTPYIFDDRCDFRDIANKLNDIYNIPKEELKALGLEGRKWITGNESMMSAKNMCKNVIEGIEETFIKFVPSKNNFTLTKIEDKPKNKIKHPVIYE